MLPNSKGVLALAAAAAVAVLLPGWLSLLFALATAAFFVWLSDFSKVPVEVDRPKRALLTDRYALSKVPSDLDAVVIGSGMSGLTCAAILARQGKKVVVLEQHDRAGGCTHMFDFKGYEFDSGLHYTVPWSTPLLELTCCSKDTPSFDLMGEPDGTFDRIVIGENAPFKVKLGEKHLPDLYAQFPEEKKALDAYMDLSNAGMMAVKLVVVSKLLPKWLQPLFWKLVPAKYHEVMSKTAKDLLPALTSNNHLIALLSSMWIDTGARPDKATFMLTSSVFRGLAMEGASYPAGGSGSMASVIIPVIERNGGRVLVRASVDEILVEDGHVLGVRMANGDVIKAAMVVSSCGYHNTFGKLISETTTSKLSIPRRLTVDDSAGFVMCNIGIRAKPEEVDITNANTWYIPVDKDGDMFGPMEAFFENPTEADIPCFITFPSMKDQTWKEKHPDMISCQMLVMAEYEWFQQWKDQPSGARGAEYEQLKQHWTDRCVAALVKQYPKAKDKIEFVDLSTPLSIEHYICASRGGAVGLDVCPKRFSDWEVQQHLDSTTAVEGLYLTGQDTLIIGVTLAQLAGVITAVRILGYSSFVKLVGQAMFFS